MPLPETRLLVCARCGVSERRSNARNTAIKYCLPCGTAVNRKALKKRREAEKEGRTP